MYNEILISHKKNNFAFYQNMYRLEGIKPMKCIKDNIILLNVESKIAKLMKAEQTGGCQELGGIGKREVVMK